MRHGIRRLRLIVLAVVISSSVTGAQRCDFQRCLNILKRPISCSSAREFITCAVRRALQNHACTENTQEQAQSHIKNAAEFQEENCHGGTFTVCHHQICLDLLNGHRRTCGTVEEGLHCAETQVLDNPDCPANLRTQTRTQTQQGRQYLAENCRELVPPAEPAMQPPAEPPVQPRAQQRGLSPRQRPVLPARQRPVQPQRQPPVQPQRQPPVQPQRQPPVQPQRQPPVQPQRQPPMQAQGQPQMQAQGQPPMHAQDQPPGVPLEQQPGVPLEQQPGVPLEQQPGVPLEQQPGVPLEQQPGVPLEQQPDVPVVTSSHVSPAPPQESSSAVSTGPPAVCDYLGCLELLANQHVTCSVLVHVRQCAEVHVLRNAACPLQVKIELRNQLQQEEQYLQCRQGAIVTVPPTRPPTPPPVTHEPCRYRQCLELMDNYDLNCGIAIEVAECSRRLADNPICPNMIKYEGQSNAHQAEEYLRDQCEELFPGMRK